MKHIDLDKNQIKSKVVKIRSNIIWGCGTCNNKWYQDDYKGEQKYYDGEECPVCHSIETFPI